MLPGPAGGLLPTSSLHRAWPQLLTAAGFPMSLRSTVLVLLTQSPCPTVPWALRVPSMEGLFAERVIRRFASLVLVASSRARADSEPVAAGPRLHCSEEDPIASFRE
jgi:hypothetical protein